MLEKAVAEVCSAVHPRTLVIGDLGCGSGKNALIFLSEVINAMRGHPAELQFFLNDLPGNDFNQIFQSSEEFKNSTAADHKGERLPPFYIAGVPGSYYTRLFPFQSVHVFHSSFSLHWHSQVRKMEICTNWMQNDGVKSDISYNYSRGYFFIHVLIHLQEVLSFFFPSKTIHMDFFRKIN